MVGFLYNKKTQFFSLFNYNPKKFWEKRSDYIINDVYSKEKYRIQEKILLEYLKGIQFSTVFEFGSGFEELQNYCWKILKSKNI